MFQRKGESTLPCGQSRSVSVTRVKPLQENSALGGIQEADKNFYKVKRATFALETVQDCRLPCSIKSSFYIEKSTKIEQFFLLSSMILSNVERADSMEHPTRKSCWVSLNHEPDEDSDKAFSLECKMRQKTFDIQQMILIGRQLLRSSQCGLFCFRKIITFATRQLQGK